MYYTITSTRAVSGAAEVISFTAPASNPLGKRAFLSKIEITSTAKLAFTLEKNGGSPAASGNVLTPTPLIVGVPASLFTAKNNSPASAGTVFWNGTAEADIPEVIDFQSNYRGHGDGGVVIGGEFVADAPAPAFCQLIIRFASGTATIQVNALYREE